MQVHGQHAVDAHRCQHIGDDLRRDCHTRGARTTVLTCIAHVRNCCCHARRRCALQCIDHDEHFHQVVVRRRTDRLQNENVFAAHVFEHLDHNLTVAEAADFGFAEMDVQMLHDIRRQFWRRIAGEHH